MRKTGGVSADLAAVDGRKRLNMDKTMTIICFIVGYAANNLIVAKFFNYLLYAFVAIGLLFMIYFLVIFVIPGTDHMWDYFVAHIVSRMVQTFIYSIPFYFINHFVYSTLSPEAG